MYQIIIILCKFKSITAYLVVRYIFNLSIIYLYLTKKGI